MAFTASQLLKVQTVADDVWADNRTRIDYIAECDVAKAIQAETTASLSPLTDPNKTNTVKLIWLNTCDITDAAVGDDCAITGPELTSDSEDYVLDIFRKTSFFGKGNPGTNRRIHPSAADRTRPFAVRPDSLRVCRGTMCFKLESFRGTNTYTTPGSSVWTFGSSDTEVPADQWTTSLMPKLSLAARKNKFLNPALISGEALWYMNEER